MNILDLYKLQGENIVLSSWFKIDGELFKPVLLKDVPINELNDFINMQHPLSVVEDYYDYVYMFNNDLLRRRTEKINKIKNRWGYKDILI